MKLTPAKRRLLEYVLANGGTVHLWPVGIGSATRQRCEAEGLIEHSGGTPDPRTGFFWRTYRITPKGLAAL